MGRRQPSNGTIVGVALLLFGSIILGVGMHHVVATGTCSSTGYSANYGPVARCPAGEGWWIFFIIGGIMLGVIGGIMSGGSSAALIIPAIFSGIGLGSLSIVLDHNVHSSTKTFAIIFGGAFAICGVLPALFMGFAGLRRAASYSGGSGSSKSAFGTPSGSDAIMSAYAEVPHAATASPSARPATATFTPGSISSYQSPSPTTSSTKPAGDALDKIAKLAKLHESGALTDDEFNREKAKLLAEL